MIMSNYKNLTFCDSMDGFEAWQSAFPHMMNSDIKHRAICYNGGYYLELNAVQIRDLRNTPFLGYSLRKYNNESKDFCTLHPTTEEHLILSTQFDARIRKFCAKYDCPVRY